MKWSVWWTMKNIFIGHFTSLLMAVIVTNARYCATLICRCFSEMGINIRDLDIVQFDRMKVPLHTVRFSGVFVKVKNWIKTAPTKTTCLLPRFCNVVIGYVVFTGKIWKLNLFTCKNHIAHTLRVLSRGCCFDAIF